MLGPPPKAANQNPCPFGSWRIAELRTQDCEFEDRACPSFIEAQGSPVRLVPPCKEL